jgi:hypothetical protein
MTTAFAMIRSTMKRSKEQPGVKGNLKGEGLLQGGWILSDKEGFRALQGVVSDFGCYIVNLFDTLQLLLPIINSNNNNNSRLNIRCYGVEFSI